jgi:hypothetical protein
MPSGGYCFFVFSRYHSIDLVRLFSNPIDDSIDIQRYFQRKIDDFRNIPARGETFKGIVNDKPGHAVEATGTR